MSVEGLATQNWSSIPPPASVTGGTVVSSPWSDFLASRAEPLLFPLAGIGILGVFANVVVRLLRKTLPPPPAVQVAEAPAPPSPPRATDNVFLCVLGKGGFGEVCKFRSRSTGHIFAIKESRGMNSTEVDSLEREHRNISGVEHPNVVKILRFERGDGFARLFLEWCPGGSLTDRIHKSQIAGRTEPEKIGEALLRNYTRQIVSGLKFLHDKGILHRDIKPGNILIHYDGSLKLTDFGLSRHTETINPKTKACGTVRYMSPESIGGSFSVFSDIWAVGATVTEMASGELPWSQLDQSLQQDYLLVGYIFRNRGSTLNHPSIPTALSVEAKDFLNTCFQQEPHLRGTCDALLKHPFLAPRIGTPA